MHAVILAGGKGVRLRPYTTALPKPLVPIGDQHAILEIVMRQLAAAGFTTVTLAIGHLGHIIRAYVGNGSQWGLRVGYAVEDTPLGTMGPLLTMLDRLPENFLVMNGDILTDLDFAGVLRHHEEAGAPLTIATYAREVKIDFGVLTTEQGSITAFREKPSMDYRVSMGVYGVSRTALSNYTPDSRSASTSWSSTCWPPRPRRPPTSSTVTGWTSAGRTTTTGRTPSSPPAARCCCATTAPSGRWASSCPSCRSRRRPVSSRCPRPNRPGSAPKGGPREDPAARRQRLPRPARRHRAAGAARSRTGHRGTPARPRSAP